MADNYDASALAILPFPIPGPQLRRLYRHHWTAENGTDQEREKLNKRNVAARPWDPATLGTSALRLEMWRWLEEVVKWFNHEYAWDTSQAIPACWPEHPHLIHEIAVMADDRYRAGQAHDGAPLENWHRVCVPWFRSRMKESIQAHCEERHQTWPSRARYARYVSQDGFNQRWLRVNEDVVSVGILTGKPWVPIESGDELNVVTGEIKNTAEDDELRQETEEGRQALASQDPLLGDEPGASHENPHGTEATLHLDSRRG